MRSASLIGPTTRVRLVCVLLLVGFGVLAARAAHLTVIDSRGRGWGDRQTHRMLRIPAPRGVIFDRNGVELAVTVRAPSIYVMPLELEDVPRSAAALAEIVGCDADALAATLAKRRSFTFVKRWVGAREAERVRALELPGVGVLEEPRRAYPAGSLAGQLIGFANIDGVGVRAIEQLEDETLRGEQRKIRVERDARGRLLSVDPVLPGEIAGGDVRLTIDAALQAEAERALARALEKTGADGGIVITIDPKSGDLLSLAESPVVDPNRFRDVDFAETRSRAFLDALEPGSTLKAFLVAGALDDGKLRRDELIDTGEGRLRVPGKTIRDHHGYGELLPKEVLGLSSNIGAVLIGQRYTPAEHYALLSSFGFGRPTGSGFPQESAGLMRDPSGWKPVDQATISFGQGLSVTPVQLAVAMATLANGGVLHEPRIVAARREPRGAWTPTEPGRARRVLGEAAARATVEMLETTVSPIGTGRRAALRGLRVAGKTGTAQKLDADTGRYSQTDYTAWFLGIVPADDPQLVIAVALDEPEGLAHGGGDTAAPLFAEVASAQLAHFGIATAPQRMRSEEFVTREERRREREGTAERMLAAKRPAPKVEPAAKRAPVVAARREPAPPAKEASVVPVRADGAVAARGPAAAPAAARAHFVPDFRGATVASAIEMAQRDSLTLELLGDRRGLAVEQHPDPGTVVTGDRPRVRLRFTIAREEG